MKTNAIETRASGMIVSRLGPLRLLTHDRALRFQLHSMPTSVTLKFRSAAAVDNATNGGHGVRHDVSEIARRCTRRRNAEPWRSPTS